MKKQRRNIGLALVAMMLIATVVEARQISRRSQFMINTYMVNPAVAGTQSYMPIFLSYRNQWTGFEGAPKTMMLSAHRSLPFNLGAGIQVFTDKTGGAISKTGVVATGAYHVELNKWNAISFGLSLSATQFKFNNSNLQVYDPNDVVLNGGVNESKTLIDSDFGFLVYGKQYYFGASVPQWMRTRMKFETAQSPDDNRDWRHFQLVGSYKYYINDTWDIQPSMLMRFTKATPVQLDVNTRVSYLGKVWAGLTYRHKDAMSWMVGAVYMDFTFNYAYDHVFSPSKILSPHTHEICVGYYLRKESTRFRSSKLGPRKLDRKKLVD